MKVELEDLPKDILKQIQGRNIKSILQKNISFKINILKSSFSILLYLIFIIHYKLSITYTQYYFCYPNLDYGDEINNVPLLNHGVFYFMVFIFVIMIIGLFLSKLSDKTVYYVVTDISLLIVGSQFLNQYMWEDFYGDTVYDYHKDELSLFFIINRKKFIENNDKQTYLTLKIEGVRTSDDFEKYVYECLLKNR